MKEKSTKIIIFNISCKKIVIFLTLITKTQQLLVIFDPIKWQFL